MGVVFLFPSTPDTDVADMNYTVVVLFGTLFLSVAWYYFPVYGGVHWFTGPVPTIVSRTEATGDADTDDGDAASDDMSLKKTARARVDVSESTPDVC